MTAKGERYHNRYTGKIVTVSAVESVRIGPGDKRIDVVVLDDGSRWQAGGGIYPSHGFGACHVREEPRP